MTVAEQLMRKMCDGKATEIRKQADTRAERCSDYIPDAELSKRVLEMRTRLGILKEESAALEKQLAKLGFQYQSNGLSNSSISLNYDRRNKERAKVWAVANPRLGKIAALRDKLAIDLMGMESKAAKLELLKLQKQLEAI